MTQTDDKPTKKTPIWRRYVILGMPLFGIAAAFAAGIIFWGGFNTAMEATNTKDFCISCHEMEDYVYAEYKGTIHNANRSGVEAVCSDCHVPKAWTHKMIRKVKASKELWGKFTGKINTPEKFEHHRLSLAMNEWNRMKKTDSRECRNCHHFDAMMPEFQKPRARAQHLNAMETGQTCIDCHKGIAHKDVRDRADEEYLAALEAPNPDFAREIPQAYLDSLAKIEAKEAAEAEALKAQKEADRARLLAAIDDARADERAKVEAELAAANTAASSDATVAGSDGAPASAGGAVAANVDWNAVPATELGLFYPGQASFEWVQNGKTHGGARPLTKGGDACSTCHAKELETIGNKIVAGGGGKDDDLEPTPIPGKRGYISASLQATHDNENVYFRMQWEDGGHNPVPFVDGGKMDPENPIKVAMMITGTDIEMGGQVGCWASCHADNSYMPFDPGADAIAAEAEVAARLQADGTVTKYLSESRTEIELKGRGDKPLGGWNLPKPEDAIAAYLEGGTYLDLLRVYADGRATNGYLLERRVENDGQIAAEAKNEAGIWTVTFSRPLVTGHPGDIAIEPGKTYTVGFAIHDDHSAARFHHVTLDTTLALDNPEVAINVAAQ
ncbi:NapC/NirT family cytochrome c [Thalassococcus sp. CAU 1522]|uniref:NapC/NirT family cytochrome c n=1 Tax=Thalassococcus arenae TaxID=2851652 RepID=A0ABS6NC98_9RHOB|nr:NapC/NirT family cytochrome c [Thalassococcus arenae]MBV2361651.1 NapC/NirT family cytochrome c [Thalassococcus arenae]